MLLRLSAATCMRHCSQILHGRNTDHVHKSVGRARSVRARLHARGRPRSSPGRHACATVPMLGKRPGPAIRPANRSVRRAAPERSVVQPRRIAVRKLWQVPWQRRPRPAGISLAAYSNRERNHIDSRLCSALIFIGSRQRENIGLPRALKAAQITADQSGGRAATTAMTDVIGAISINSRQQGTRTGGGRDRSLPMKCRSLFGKSTISPGRRGAASGSPVQRTTRRRRRSGTE